jgi:hypothetical protein
LPPGLLRALNQLKPANPHLSESTFVLGIVINPRTTGLTSSCPQ